MPANVAMYTDVHLVGCQLYPICKFGINLCNAAPGVPLLCQLALTFCQSTQFAGVLAVAGNINVYDIRKPCIGMLCYDFSRLDKYLAQPHVRKALGVGDRKCVPGCLAPLLEL